MSVPGLFHKGRSQEKKRPLRLEFFLLHSQLIKQDLFRSSAPCARLPGGCARRQLAFYGECVPLANEQSFTKFLDSLVEEDWVVYAKSPFGGPEHVLHYLARYTHRIGISNHRILAVNQVLFRWKDYAHHNKQRTLSLTCEEFLRRFLQHVLPKGFPRIRYFGWLANRRRKKLLRLCRDRLPPLAQQTSAQPEPPLWL
jgi:hypothetical protein